MRNELPMLPLKPKRVSPLKIDCKFPLSKLIALFDTNSALNRKKAKRTMSSGANESGGVTATRSEVMESACMHCVMCCVYLL